MHVFHGLAGAPRDRTATALLMLVEMPSFRMDHKDAIAAALRFWEEQPALD